MKTTRAIVLLVLVGLGAPLLWGCQTSLQRVDMATPDESYVYDHIHAVLASFFRGEGDPPLNVDMEKLAPAFAQIQNYCVTSEVRITSLEVNGDEATVLATAASHEPSS